jgi:hypothetical protein
VVDTKRIIGKNGGPRRRRGRRSRFPPKISIVCNMLYKTISRDLVILFKIHNLASNKSELQIPRILVIIESAPGPYDLVIKLGFLCMYLYCMGKLQYFESKLPNFCQFIYKFLYIKSSLDFNGHRRTLQHDPQQPHDHRRRRLLGRQPGERMAPITNLFNHPVKQMAPRPHPQTADFNSIIPNRPFCDFGTYICIHISPSTIILSVLKCDKFSRQIFMTVNP